jgi:hypothetical protein
LNNQPIRGFIVPKVCVAVLAFGLLPKCKAAQANLTRLLLADAADTPRRWAVTPLCTKPIGVVTIAWTKTKHD